MRRTSLPSIPLGFFFGEEKKSYLSCMIVRKLLSRSLASGHPFLDSYRFCSLVSVLTFSLKFACNLFIYFFAMFKEDVFLFFSVQGRRVVCFLCSRKAFCVSLSVLMKVFFFQYQRNVRLFFT